MKQYSILLVDDEESIRLSVRYQLEKVGYRVFSAENGDVAVEKIKNNHFDIIITDLMMDGTDGIGVLKEAKILHPTILVMVLTGYGSVDTAVEAMRLGAFDYLQKPCSKEELLIRTNKCIEQIKLNRKLKVFEKIIPICCVCKKIRDDQGREPGTGDWMEPDLYIEKNSNLETSHGYCDECAKVLEKEALLANQKKSDSI